MRQGTHIAVNTRLLLPDKLEGIGYFAYETLRHIVHSHPEVTFHFLFDRPYSEQFVFADNVRPVVLYPPARHPLLWYLWCEWSVAMYLRRHEIDLYLSPDGYGSLRGATPSVLVQHDIAYEHYPSYVPRLTAMYYQYYVPRYLRQASRIATVSAYSKNDIATHYHIPTDKIDVIYNAAKEIFQPIDTATQQAVRDQYTQGHPYLLYIGAIHPRKNLSRMMEAFDRFKTKHPSPLQFLIVGAMGWQNSSLKTLYDSLSHRGDIVFLGRQPEETLARLTASAFGLLYVSMFEGFGVPPIEAMQCGVPVITASVSSMPEICGDAALYAAPTDVAAIADCIAKLWMDESLRNKLIQRGILQAKKYSWEQSAALLWDSCERVLNYQTT